MTAPKLIVSYGASSNLARITSVKTLTWQEYASELCIAHVGTDKTARGWSIPASFSPRYRDSENFEYRYALTFDYDHITADDLTVIRQAYDGLAHIAYTTFSHTESKPRWRYVLPLSRPVTFDEFQAISREVADYAGIRLAARESHVPAQMMFLPVCRTAADFHYAIKDGHVLDADEVLASYIDWTDRTEWPKRDADDTHSGEATDPTTKPGIVGDFCRAYTISAAIDRFDLPYEHVHGNRWTYTAGSRAEGAIVYDDDHKLHSHHDSDPAHGQHNAFDLVRLHHFGGLDKECDIDAPITERPSYREMARTAAIDPLVREQAALTAFDDLGPEDALPAPEPPKEALAKPLSVVLTHPTRPRWLIRDEIERGVMALMAGPRGSYKSFKALHWAMTTACAGEPVYVVSAEGGDFERRAAAWMIHHNVAQAPPLFVVERRLNLNSRDGIELIRQDCQRLGIRPALFVLDTFSKLSGGLDENSNSEVKQFIGRLDNGLKRPDAFDATVLLVAHTGHTETGRARGASALEADTDAAYIVQKDAVAGLVRVTRERFKSSSELPPLVYKPCIVDLDRLDDDGQQVTSLVLEPVHGTPAAGSKRPGGKNQKHLWNVLLELAPGGAPLAVEDLLDEAVGRLPRDSSGRDLRRQNLRRALDALVIEKQVFLHGEAVSTTPLVVGDWLDG